MGKKKKNNVKTYSNPYIKEHLRNHCLIKPAPIAALGQTLTRMPL
jgi:hypothetical protein